MTSLFEGSWSCQDFIEAKQEDKAPVRVGNSAVRVEHTCTLRLRTSSSLTVTIESPNCEFVYSVEILPRDLLVPVYHEASLLWVKLLLAKALKGEVALSLNFITMDELRVNSVFYREPVTLPHTVAEVDAAAIVLEVVYTMESKKYTVLLQVPKLLPEDWKTGEIEELFEQLMEPSDLYMKNLELQKVLEYVKEEKELAQQRFQETHLELERIKSSLSPN